MSLFWEWVGKPIVGSFIAAMEWISSKIQKMVTSVVVKKEGPIPKETVQTEETVKQEATKFLEREILPIVSMPFCGVKHVAEIRRPALERSYLSFIALDYIIRIAGELAGLTQMEAFSGVMDSYQRLLSIPTIGEGLFKTWIHYGFNIPMEYYVKSRTRSIMLDLGTSREALSRGKITDSEFINLMHLHGFQDEFFRIFKELASSPIPPFLQRLMADIEFYDERTLDWVLTDYGYGLETKRIMKNLLKIASIFRFRGYLISSLLTGFREGFLTKEFVEKELRNFGFSDEVIKVIISVAEIQAEIERKEIALKTIREMFRKGEIDLSGLKTLLRGMKIEPRFVEAIAGYEATIRKEKKDIDTLAEYRKAFIPILTRAFRAGLITIEDAIKELKFVGVDEKVIKFIVDKLELEYEILEKEEMVKIYVEGFKKGLITESEFKEGLIGLKMRADKVERLVELERLRALPKPKPIKS